MPSSKKLRSKQAQAGPYSFVFWNPRGSGTSRLIPFFYYALFWNVQAGRDAAVQEAQEQAGTKAKADEV
jgi:hypothetical protein